MTNMHTESALPRLKRSLTGSPPPTPLRTVLFGEGNFLRAFICWMFQILNDQKLFEGSIKIIEPLPDGLGSVLNEQDGLYTVLLRGLETGHVIEKTHIISCVEGALNAYRDWNDVLATARLESLQFVFSNTTESGIDYKPETFQSGKTPETFPAKLTAFLFERFNTLAEHQRGGLWIIPCELIENNAAVLKQYVLRYADDWNLDDGFIRWIEQENQFVNTLVDRIVAGYPKSEAETICRKLGYDDRLITSGEPFHFFALQTSQAQKLESVWPIGEAGLNVVLTDDITPYRMRKVFLLNGGHTSTALAAFRSGLDFVEEITADYRLNRYLRKLLQEEVLPCIDLPVQETSAFIESVLERFANPFAKHRLYSIALNSVAKWKVRVLPSLLKSYATTETLPQRIVFSLAALIVFYDNVQGKGKRENGEEYDVADDGEVIQFFESVWTEHRNDVRRLVQTVLGRSDFWGCDLNEVESLSETVSGFIERIQAGGMRSALIESALC